MLTLRKNRRRSQPGIRTEAAECLEMRRVLSAATVAICRSHDATIDQNQVTVDRLDPFVSGGEGNDILAFSVSPNGQRFRVDPNGERFSIDPNGERILG